MISIVRRIDDESDRTIRRLLTSDPGDEAIELLLAAFIPMLRHRCRNDRTQVDEALGELSIVLVEMVRFGVPETDRWLANLIVDKAWDAHRATMRRARRAELPLDPQCSHAFNDGAPDDGHRQVLDRAALRDFRKQVMRAGAADPRFVDVWNEVLDLAALEHRTPVQRNRWKYLRPQIRRVAPPEILA